jgi:sugar phosphate isomerase/epimerase
MRLRRHRLSSIVEFSSQERFMNGPLFSCQEQLIPGNNYREKYLYLSEIGFSGIEIWSNHLDDHFDELAELYLSKGVRVSSGCQSFEGGLIDCNDQARQAAIHSTIKAVQALSKLGGNGYVLPAGFALGSLVLPPYRPPQSPDEDTRALTDALTRILEETAESGVSIFLEPINRYETHFLHTLAEAESIVATIDHPLLGITADLFHMSMEEANLEESIRNCGPKIKHIHIADSNRKLPGQGHLDFVKLFSAIQQINFQGWMTIECDNPENAEIELPEASQYLHQCWEQAAQTV